MDGGNLQRIYLHPGILPLLWPSAVPSRKPPADLGVTVGSRGIGTVTAVMRWRRFRPLTKLTVSGCPHAARKFSRSRSHQTCGGAPGIKGDKCEFFREKVGWFGENFGSILSLSAIPPNVWGPFHVSHITSDSGGANRAPSSSVLGSEATVVHVLSVLDPVSDSARHLSALEMMVGDLA